MLTIIEDKRDCILRGWALTVVNMQAHDMMSQPSSLERKDLERYTADLVVSAYRTLNNK